VEDPRVGRIKIQNKIIIILLVIIIVVPLAGFFMFFHVFNYGFQIDSCEYKEKILPIPNELNGAKIVFGKNYSLYPQEKYGKCVPISNSVTFWISDAGGTKDHIVEGTQMSLKYIIAQTKYGVGTIDSGGGPWFDFILSDEKGNLYSLSSVYFLNDAYQSINIKKNGEKINPLTEFQLEALYSK